MKVCRLCRRYAVGVAETCTHDGGELLEGPVPPFVPGDELGSYEVKRAFAAGDTGVLLSAEPSGDEEGGHPVVIKVLAPVRGAVDARESVLESVAKLDVEGLHPIDETFEEDGHLCMVRPFLPGSTLAARVKVEGPLEPTAVVDLGRRLCAILSAVHSEGLAHGDVRPGHVLLPEGDGAGEAVLLDLGSPSSPGANAAPELHQDKAALPSADVYGLCMTLYIALVGRSPFRADASEELSWIVRSSPPPPLRVMREIEVDQVLERIIMWGLSKDPAARPTVSEVSDVLGAVAAEDGKKAEEVLVKAPRPGAKGRKGPPRDSIPPGSLTHADESSPTLRMVRKLLPKSVLKSTGLTAAFFVDGEDMERELAELEREESQAARENALAWIRAVAFLLIGASLAALAIWGLTR